MTANSIVFNILLVLATGVFTAVLTYKTAFNQGVALGCWDGAALASVDLNGYERGDAIGTCISINKRE